MSNIRIIKKSYEQKLQLTNKIKKLDTFQN
jgi:hypothetical protein